MPRRKHNCGLDLGSDSMLPTKKTNLGKAYRKLRKLGQLSIHHPETYDHFRSYPAVVAERQRLLLENGGNIIHPLSLFNLFWRSMMIVVNIAHIYLSTFRLYFIIQPLDSLETHILDHVLLGLHCVCLIDICIKFNTGYVVRIRSYVVMARKSIFWRYIRCWFVVDLVSSLPLAYFLLTLEVDPPYILVAHVLATLRVARLYTAYGDSKIFMRLFTQSYIVHGMARLAALFVLTGHLCTCLMYLPAIFNYYWTGEISTDYNYYMRIKENESLMTCDVQTRYNKAIIITISAFLGTGFTMFRSTEPDEIIIHSIVIVYAALFMVFTIVFLIKSYLMMYACSVRYQGLMNQVEEYMKYRQFPLALKKRVEAFYQYRYQKLYFKEEADLGCLSEELRDEIKLYTCRSLVNKVRLFDDVPASVVGTVLGCLRPEVYLSNDLVVRAGDTGDCMYFIATGTVAVYSLKGIEVCHLEDGNHFGEVALLMKDSKRVATVVAVENTQLYRLDALDFNRFVLSHSTLYKRIEELASRRIHETVLLDDKYRRDKGEMQSSHGSPSNSSRS
ncbi:hypothetical protein PYW07_016381 [Mythimna separata]|uniref:Cyclic nucleotide-binding domain-containing protein n=1 Tax=Mythimna separata TaxID=271217 RepID=A0AAD7YJJ7_MYTSE|nr:hypothetical protein PYW07_016381 [Mythimna separata]